MINLSEDIIFYVNKRKKSHDQQIKIGFIRKY